MPLPYQPESNDIPGKPPPTGFDALRTLAASRIYAPANSARERSSFSTGECSASPDRNLDIAVAICSAGRA
jgi:2-iminoacetate synthase ThiH